MGVNQKPLAAHLTTVILANIVHKADERHWECASEHLRLQMKWEKREGFKGNTKLRDIWC